MKGVKGCTIIVFSLLGILATTFQACRGVSGNQERMLGVDSSQLPVAIHIPEVKDPKHVVDYFNIVRSLESQVSPYDLIFIENTQEWKCFGTDMEIEHTCVVDIKNGYIRIRDESTGGGATTVEFAIFNTKENQNLLALNLFSSTAAVWHNTSNSSLKFFRYNGTLQDVTSSVYPAPMLAKDFFRNQDAGCMDTEMYYELPRSGTTIKAKLNTTVCSNCDPASEAFMMADTEIKKCCKYCSDTLRTEHLIPFDIERGKFLVK